MLSLALVGTGFLADTTIRSVQGEVLRHVLPRVRDVRRSGCPALDLCAIASGTLDVCYESGLGRWDIAAGAAIAEAPKRRWPRGLTREICGFSTVLTRSRGLLMADSWMTSTPSGPENR